MQRFQVTYNSRHQCTFFAEEMLNYSNSCANQAVQEKVIPHFFKQHNNHLNNNIFYIASIVISTEGAIKYTCFDLGKEFEVQMVKLYTYCVSDELQGGLEIQEQNNVPPQFAEQIKINYKGYIEQPKIDFFKQKEIPLTFIPCELPTHPNKDFSPNNLVDVTTKAEHVNSHEFEKYHKEVLDIYISLSILKPKKESPDFTILNDQLAELKTLLIKSEENVRDLHLELNENKNKLNILKQQIQFINDHIKYYKILLINIFHKTINEYAALVFRKSIRDRDVEREAFNAYFSPYYKILNTGELIFLKNLNVQSSLDEHLECIKEIANKLSKRKQFRLLDSKLKEHQLPIVLSKTILETTFNFQWDNSVNRIMKELHALELNRVALQATIQSNEREIPSRINRINTHIDAMKNKLVCYKKRHTISDMLKHFANKEHQVWQKILGKYLQRIDKPQKGKTKKRDSKQEFIFKTLKIIYLIEKNSRDYLENKIVKDYLNSIKSELTNVYIHNPDLSSATMTNPLEIISQVIELEREFRLTCESALVSEILENVDGNKNSISLIRSLIDQIYIHINKFKNLNTMDASRMMHCLDEIKLHYKGFRTALLKELHGTRIQHDLKLYHQVLEIIKSADYFLEKHLNSKSLTPIELEFHNRILQLTNQFKLKLCDFYELDENPSSIAVFEIEVAALINQFEEVTNQRREQVLISKKTSLEVKKSIKTLNNVLIKLKGSVDELQAFTKRNMSREKVEINSQSLLLKQMPDESSQEEIKLPEIDIESSLVEIAHNNQEQVEMNAQKPSIKETFQDKIKEIHNLKLIDRDLDWKIINLEAMDRTKVGDIKLKRAKHNIKRFNLAVELSDLARKEGSIEAANSWAEHANNYLIAANKYAFEASKLVKSNEATQLIKQNKPFNSKEMERIKKGGFLNFYENYKNIYNEMIVAADLVARETAQQYYSELQRGISGFVSELKCEKVYYKLPTRNTPDKIKNEIMNGNFHQYFMDDTKYLVPKESETLFQPTAIAIGISHMMSALEVKGEIKDLRDYRTITHNALIELTTKRDVHAKRQALKYNAIQRSYLDYIAKDHSSVAQFFEKVVNMFLSIFKTPLSKHSLWGKNHAIQYFENQSRLISTGRNDIKI